MATEFTIPQKILYGPEALLSAGSLLPGFGKKALIVTGKVMVRLGNCRKVERILEEAGLEWAVFSDIPGEPTDEMVEAGARCYLRENCDFLIGLGGGSPIDTMKAIGVVVKNGGPITGYMGREIQSELPPMVAIPTTAGTGSEATRFTIITDTRRNIKMLLKGPALMPTLAVADPQFTVTAPPEVTAATGLDALCHAVEAYTSRKAQPLTDTFAISAVTRIFKNLPEAYRNGQNVQARTQLSIAALEAGIAFSNSSVTLIHGMSRPIGALFHVAHGLSNAMLMNVCLAYALPGAYERFARLAQAIGAAEASDSEEAAAEKFLAALNELTTQLEIPNPEQYGIERERLLAAVPKMALDAMASGSPQNTRRCPTQADIEAMYRALIPERKESGR